MEISEFKNGKWQPFDGNDVYVDFVMIDPYVRRLMKRVKGKFTTSFRIPDRHGVYKFRVEYKKFGFSWLNFEETVQIRPTPHNQYPRFLTVAYPYYANLFSVMFGFLIFSAVFLYSKPPKTKNE
jgi:oligosaccharyltransferase complex subunit beta